MIAMFPSSTIQIIIIRHRNRTIDESKLVFLSQRAFNSATLSNVVRTVEFGSDRKRIGDFTGMNKVHRFSVRLRVSWLHGISRKQRQKLNQEDEENPPKKTLIEWEIQSNKTRIKRWNWKISPKIREKRSKESDRRRIHNERKTVTNRYGS